MLVTVIHDDGVAAGCDDTVLVVTRSAATTAVCSSTQYDCCHCRCSSLRTVVIFATMSVGDTTARVMSMVWGQQNLAWLQKQLLGARQQQCHERTVASLCCLLILRCYSPT